jgi:hypothetical protein
MLTTAKDKAEEEEGTLYRDENAFKFSSTQYHSNCGPNLFEKQQ